MLLEDNSIAQQFQVIFRVAQLLQQVTFSTAVSKRIRGISATREVGGAEVSTLVTLPGLKSDGSYCGLTEQQAHTTSHVRPKREASGNAADPEALQRPLQLSVGSTDESAATLRQLGWILNRAARQLQVNVDAQLVDFYAHVREKVNIALPEGKGRKEREMPACDFPQGPPASLSLPPSSIPVPPPQREDISSSLRLHEDEGGASRTGSARPRATALAYPDGTKEASFSKDAAAVVVVPVTATPGMDTIRTEGAAVPSIMPTLRQPNIPYPQRGGHSRIGTPNGLQNAPMTRRLEEERAAASELQSFFSILLEAALRLTGASAAAVYMDDTPQFAAGGAGTSFSCPMGSTAAASGASGGGRGHFLQCVAHSHGRFPSSISYAISNVLTTVATTGVAVNVHYSESSLLRVGIGGDSAPGDLDSARHYTKAGGGIAASDGARGQLRNDSNGCSHRPLLDMYNGVVVPIKDIGCLVLANKAKAAALGVKAPCFSVFDEHVAWSAALLSEAVLHRYERQLLLRATWSPSCVSALRPYTQENAPLNRSGSSLPSRNGSSMMRERRGLQSRMGSKRFFSKANNTAAQLTAADVVNAAVSSLVFDPQNDIFSKTLTMVRTGDPKVLKVLPQELCTSSSSSSGRRPINSVISTMAAEAATSGAPEKLRDEQVFHAAAEYITNLESLWRRTISESNAMHTLIERYNKEMRKQEETIALLEAKVRELSMHMTQLERRGNFARLNAP